jgi:hypothetical protein
MVVECLLCATREKDTRVCGRGPALNGQEGAGHHAAELGAHGLESGAQGADEIRRLAGNSDDLQGLIETLLKSEVEEGVADVGGRQRSGDEERQGQYGDEDFERGPFSHDACSIEEFWIQVIDVFSTPLRVGNDGKNILSGEKVWARCLRPGGEAPRGLPSKALDPNPITAPVPPGWQGQALKAPSKAWTVDGGFDGVDQRRGLPLSGPCGSSSASGDPPAGPDSATVTLTCRGIMP